MKQIIMLTGLIICVAAFFTPDAVMAAQTITVLNPSGVREDGSYVDKTLKAGMLERNIQKPRLANEFPPGGKETLKIKQDAFTEVNNLFYHRGWGDGLPIVPPTPERVAAMLKGSDLPPDFVVATIDPLGGEATVEKIAVNAVMAGCQPAYMPILIAAVEAVTQPEADLRGSSTTTSPDAPMLIVSGPIVEELGINSGSNTFGRGWRANSSISRAYHLILQNIGGSWPNVTDMSCIGQPGDFVMFMAENTRATNWGPLHATQGVPRDVSAVTVLAAEGYHGILGIGQTPERFLNLAADKIKSDNWPFRHSVLLVLANDTAEMLGREGWTRESIEKHVRERATVPLGEFKQYFLGTGADIGKGIPEWVGQSEDMNQAVPRPFIDQFLIMVAGGVGEKSMVIPGWHSGKVVSREVRLPHNWQELLRQTDESPANTPKP